jgi:hypothetical protein
MAVIIGLTLVAFHAYYYCYRAFATWGLTHPIVDKLAIGLARSGLFRHRALSKLLALAALVVSAVGTKTTAQVGSIKRLATVIAVGFILFFGSDVILLLNGQPETLTIFYLTTTLSGLVLLYNKVKAVASLIYWPKNTEIFNEYSESWPQEERLLKNPYSINLKARYKFRNQQRESYINLVDIFRGTLVMGTPGSGKTRYIFCQMIQQSLANGMALFVYDLKYDDLTRLTYNSFLNTPNSQTVTPQFFSVNFDDFSRSHRCNPLDPRSLDDISDATDCAKTILFALNKNWIGKQGDFFISSAIGFFTANIWFLRRYEDGKYCTLAHLLELIQTDYTKLFSILRSFPEIETLISSYISAFKNNVMEQLQGQIDSARIALSSLVSPNLYYLLSANDFTLDINNPLQPKIVCLGSNPQKQLIYSAVVSLYVSRMIKLVNRKGGQPCHLLFDEFSPFYASGMDLTIATARSNKVGVTIGIQDLSQLRKEYGRDQADALFNLPGNLISGQVTGDSARFVSERFGKILQKKSTVNTNSRDTGTSESQQLDLAMPASKISTLSSGEFVGITADTPIQKIKLKTFHAEIVIDEEAIENEEAAYLPLPEVRTVTPELVDLNFRQIKQEVRTMVEIRLAIMMKTPALSALIVTANKGLNRQVQSPIFRNKNNS